MSFVNINTFEPVDSANTDEHKTSKVSPLANREKLHQVHHLMVCTQQFAKWFGGKDKSVRAPRALPGLRQVGMERRRAYLPRSVSDTFWISVATLSASIHSASVS